MLVEKREKLPAVEANKGLNINGFEQGSILNEEYDSKISAGVYSSTDNLNNMQISKGLSIWRYMDLNSNQGNGIERIR